MACRIYMCCHKAFDTVPPLCIPIQAGRAINSMIDGIPGDDTGDSISEKNREYCELTVQYHVWKNDSTENVGFCHYRRFFCYDKSVKLPYIAFGKLSERQKKLLGTEEQIYELCRQYDIILPRAEDMGISVREYYCTSEYHHKEDLDLFVEITAELYPKLSDYMERYLSQHKQYFCNMFIMNRERFDEYCTFLFSILSEFDKRKTLHGSFQDDRTDGYLAERFVGIYLLYAKDHGARTAEISRIDTGCNTKKRIAWALLPPESRRRFLVKKLIKRLKKQCKN